MLEDSDSAGFDGHAFQRGGRHVEDPPTNLFQRGPRLPGHAIESLDIVALADLATQFPPRLKFLIGHGHVGARPRRETYHLGFSVSDGIHRRAKGVPPGLPAPFELVVEREQLGVGAVGQSRSGQRCGCWPKPQRAALQRPPRP